MDDLYKYPRVYVDAPLAAGADLTLDADHAHHLRVVLRRGDGDRIRLFNGRNGEFLAALVCAGKRDVVARIETGLRSFVPRTRRLRLFFAPLKKDRMDALIDCAVQLDATDLHPVLTERTEVRELKSDKLAAHIRDAAQQCERMDLPVLHALAPLDRALAGLDCPLFAGVERCDLKPLRDMLVPAGDAAALVGPVGGWTQGERAMLLERPGIVPVTLGPNVLRAETAVAAMLTRLAS
ncbi:MAG: 16S rRNA (uracil(1498)-N(3))-methyltransferase [Rhodospirillales bacterium]|nr:16S rRNA (uracil(1498)-N(3))-methyltransferase [Alphaproteobacteria bacterium]MCB9986521.1 16S rRNA (uracil(1498)-N(3))-methyltransferase [Rhodospirillales bacterium]USO06942.1 MAG: 16S rRNA (uracil(1498)-N(3))-methyltransferase [Rhodospirillales bacterium]